MAMTVLNNPSATMTLGELNKNVSKLGKQLKKIANGVKITGAGDDTSGYAISERMQARIRSLNQNESNAKTGMSMLKVASGGIESIIEELRSLKELAINAANDSNTTLDRTTIQKEFDQRRKNIDNIAVETNYNGKVLLTGIYNNKTVDVTTATVIPSWLSPTNPDAVGPTGAIIHSGVAEPSGTPMQITNGNYTINQSGIYELTNNSHNITIDSGVHDVKFIQAVGSNLSNVHIVGPSDGNANIWIEDLTVTNSDNSSFINFQGANNILNFKGTNTVRIPSVAYSYGGDYAVIHVGGGLTVEGGADGSGIINFKLRSAREGALIGSDGSANAGTVNASPDKDCTSPLTINSGTYAAIYETIESFTYGAFIGSGANASIGDLTVNGGSFYEENYQGGYRGGVIIGSGFRNSKCGDIHVSNAVIVSNSMQDSPSIGSCGNPGFSLDADRGRCGDIYVTNSKIDIVTEKGAGIGTGWNAGCGNITVENTEVIASSVTGAGIGSGEGGRTNNIIINNCDLTQVTSEQGEYVGRGVRGYAGTVTVNGKTPGTEGTSDQIVTLTEKKMIGKPLVIHDGTKANEAIHLYINDMRTSALKGRITNESGEFVNPEDLNHLRNLSSDPDAYKAYAGILREADGMTLDDVSVTTQHGASVAIRVVDGAIQYALDEATTVGAYISRLEYTVENITVSNENTVSSESTIRDADMAREMTEYTKSNVLTQAAQSMLAQANQNSSNVLSLLQ